MNKPPNRYRNKPIQITAVQWRGDNAAEVEQFAGDCFEVVAPEDRKHLDDPEATASLLTEPHSSWELMYTGDWVVRDERGWLFCWRDDDFRETFEAVSE